MREWCSSKTWCTGFSFSQGKTEDSDTGRGCIKDCSNNQGNGMDYGQIDTSSEAMGYHDYWEYNSNYDTNPNGRATPYRPKDTYYAFHTNTHPECSLTRCSRLTHRAFRAWCSSVDFCTGFAYDRSITTGDPNDDSNALGCIKYCSPDNHNPVWNYGSGYDWYSKVY